jgi:hypothetical protein
MPITTTPSGGPQGEFSTYTPIYAQTLSATTGSITFSNIPTTFTDLILVVNAASETTHAFLNMQFNGDTGTNYSYTELLGNGTNATSTRYTNATQMFNANVAMQQTTISFNGIYQIMNYSNSTTNKTGLARLNCINSDYNGSIAVGGAWRNTSPITSIKVFPSRSGTPYNFSIGSTFTLYGIKAAATQFIPTKAAGGDVVVSDGTYAYHVFKSSGVFAPAQALTADILVVAGGGAGSGTMAAGGGAGGLLGFTSQSLTATPYTCTIGSGGAYVGNTRVNGIDSQFGALTAAVGGGGGGWRSGSSATANGATGGSGGGGAGHPYGSSPTYGLGGSPTSGQGNAGGNGSTSGIAAGGGGGAGAAGGAAGVVDTYIGGTGGNGSSAYSSWGIATGTGELISSTRYFAGGGGGGSAGSTTLTAGPVGGYGGGGKGGNGSNVNNSGTLLDGYAGVANTGGGGGGGGQQQGTGRDGYGGNGGSGIIIVRYTL